MEWFGITLYGFPDPFKEMMRPDYHEPNVQPDLLEVIKKEKTKSFAEMVAEIDCYIGRVDGYAYRSNDRLVRMRQKGCFKPVGPSDMYKYPGTDNMKAGFWYDDEIVKSTDWYKLSKRYPKPMTEISRYIDEIRKRDKQMK